MSTLFPFFSCRSFLKKRRPKRQARKSEEISSPIYSVPASRRSSKHIELKVVFGFDAKIRGALQAKRGDIVRQINAINGWLLVQALDGREGYIPATYCVPCKQRVDDPSAAVGLSVASVSSGIGPSIGQSEDEGLKDVDNERHDRVKTKGLGTAIAVFDFLAEQPEEVSMLRGDRMIVLKDDNPDWLRVLSDEGIEGMVPKSYVYRQDRIEASSLSDILWIHDTSERGSADGREWFDDDDEMSDGDLSDNAETDALVQLVAIKDYHTNQEGFLSVKTGETIYTDISEKRTDGWLKVHSIRQGKGGLIPSLYARTPNRVTAYVSYKRFDSWDDGNGEYTETQV